MDIERIDKIVQLILAIAGEEDDKFDKDLGPIHIVKYLYLADYEYAKMNNGMIFTGLPWRFYHFGPWCETAFERIEPALVKLGAEKKVISSRVKDDFIRWSSPDNPDLFYSLSRNIPHEIVSSLRSYIHRFTNDTEELLHYVYGTKPMLQACPKESLDFSTLAKNQETDLNRQLPVESTKLSKHDRKKRKQSLADLKRKMQNQISKRKRTYTTDFEPPIYDEVFFNGVKTFDKIIGEELKSEEGLVTFSDDVWKSEARYDSDLSR